MKWNKSKMAIGKKFRLTLQVHKFRRTRLACEKQLKVSLFGDRELSGYQFIQCGVGW